MSLSTEPDKSHFQQKIPFFLRALLLWSLSFLATVAEEHTLSVGSTFENVQYKLKYVCTNFHAFS